ncbi:right-handed parallel beta-helix repeat-containing protein [uncultured Nostoc sp.]|uniref:right-handed parallel beta-helix repeat-containing protein n=1 Tax=uncultured Nostoc sp. TaxID=340711 RepID=UPI0035CB8F3E
MTSKTYYVSVTGNDKNDGLSKEAAFTLQKAANLVEAGDTVKILDGTYENTHPNSDILSISDKHGTEAAPITFAAYSTKQPPVLEAHKNNWNAILITGSSYIVIKGLTLKGAKGEIDLNYAQQHQDDPKRPETSGNGITIKKNSARLQSHHITIIDNIVSDFPGGGIAAIESDYITVENNVVSDNCSYSPNGPQGITMLNLQDFDKKNPNDYKVIIKGNTCFNNEQGIRALETGEITEGHGIILDRSYIETESGTKLFYEGKALIYNNISYNNSGAGIEIFNGENYVEIKNNTMYKNSQKRPVPVAEISLNKCENVHVSKNIMYASDVNPACYIPKSTNVSFNNNLAYNGTCKNTGSGNILDKDPLFVDAANHDFRLKSGSPAIDAGIGADPTKNTPTLKVQVLNDTDDITDESTTAINFSETTVDAGV